MAAKKGPARGASLVKKAIEASKIESPAPVVAGILKKLRLPNDEKLSAGLKTFLAYDGASLGWDFDEEEPEFEPMTLDELVESEIGEEHVGAFGEAIEMLDGDCILIESEGDTKSFLYVGEADESGEYAVISLALEADGAKVGGFVPFDVWIAQRLGVLAKGETLGGVPAEYLPFCQALAEANGSPRVSFVSTHRDIAVEKDDDESEDEDSEK